MFDGGCAARKWYKNQPKSRPAGGNQPLVMKAGFRPRQSSLIRAKRKWTVEKKKRKEEEINSNLV